MAMSEGAFPTVTETVTLQPNPRAEVAGLHLLALVLPPPAGCLDFLLLNYPLTQS